MRFFPAALLKPRLQWSMHQRIGWIALIGICSFLGGLAAHLFFATWEPPAAHGQAAREPAAPPLVTDLVVLSDRFELIAKKVSPAVVYVEAAKPTDKSAAGSRSIEESGSGVITRLDGHREYFVFTNNHVVAGAVAQKIIVHLADGRLFRPTRVWSDPETDVAVLGLDAALSLPTAALGDSDRLQVGNWVLAMGSPFGLNQTVTHGIISAKDRGQVSLGSTIRIKDFLQTDAAINPGSSGGPLINLNGEIVGINTAIASPNGNSSGVAFSIPINLFKRVSLALLDSGRVARGYLGVQLSNSFEPADALRLGLARAQGALVEVVYPDTPGARAGLKVGDVILELDDVPIRNENHLINLVSQMPAGKQVTVVVWRGRQRLTVQAVVGDWTRGSEQLRPPSP
jgi:S1-C subfamily serine protease